MPRSETLSQNGSNGNINGHSSLENSSTRPISPENAVKSATKVIDYALQLPFLQRLNGRLVAEDGTLLNTTLEFVLENEVVSVRSSETHNGRELRIGASDGFVDSSEKGSGIADIKRDGVLLQDVVKSNAHAKIEEYLTEIDRRVAEAEPQIPMAPESDCNVLRV